jgi:hypothetical protein
MIILLSSIVAVVSFFYWKSYKTSKLVPELIKKSERLETIQKEIDSLLPYKEILDAKSEAESIRNQVRSEAESLRNLTKTEVESIISGAKSEAESLRNLAKAEVEFKRNEANTYADNLKNKQTIMYDQAKKESAQLISEANVKAESIAGAAFEAMKKADSLEKTARAMKNIIEGYGDRYLIPMTSLLDTLAEAYSHTMAGDELKKARERTKNLIKLKEAAICDYVEDYRKQTAIEFVLDAFNGKTDSILATVKDDNFGTLEKKINDAFQVVNHNGTAFRNARIHEKYLGARLDELKWASTVQALKERDKEEQRKIREQIREEEKAAKDYEKALKEAQKEEETLGKAMEKIQKEMESANEMQKMKFEEKLKELQGKLTEAEEKNKRALSMAQQTKTGHVYIISNIGSFGENVYKIGMTRRLDPMDRIDELGDASVPFDFDVHAMILSEDAPNLERELHKIFSMNQVNKVNSRKEFFNVGIKEIKDHVESKGLVCHWTIAAEAREYKESIAIATKKAA